MTGRTYWSAAASGWSRVAAAVAASSVTLAAAAAVSVAAMAVVTAPAAASPEPVSRCTATAGVIVAVDLSAWRGPVLRSCGSTPTTGYALLNQGGWHTIGTEHDGPGFICRIGYSGYRHGTQYPTPEQQSCILTPPASAYWAYWQAGPGQDAWTYSQAGAMTDDPAPGSVSLWVFGGTNLGGSTGSAVPKFSPDAVRSGGAVRAAAEGTVSARTPEIIDADPVAASAPASSGSPEAAIVALAIVTALAGVSIVISRRRSGRRL